ncbi:MAG: hypothetical protein OEZ06_00620 [Myxococcales bacterium]|nr:hypothetical protein [Myxococcales bacterium]
MDAGHAPGSGRGCCRAATAGCHRAYHQRAAQYAELLARHHVERVRATATSAARDASNGQAFFEAAQSVLGVRPELLSGQEEARLSFRGATAGLPLEREPFLVIDIGGGSTEFVLGRRQPEAGVSIDIGCVRMTERHLHGDPPGPAELSACAADVAQLLSTVREAIDVAAARCVIGVAGTVTTIAALVRGLHHYDASRTHHMRLSRAQVQTQFDRLSSATVQARRSMLAESGRAEVIVGGAVVLLTLLRELDIPELLVSETDILDGLAMSLLEAPAGT